MKPTTIFHAVICMLFMATGAFAFDSSSKLGLQLSASVDNVGSIKCKVSVKNLTTGVVTLSLTKREPLFIVSIINERGQNLNVDQSAVLKRGKSLKRTQAQPLVTLILQSGQVQNLEGTVPLHSPDGATVPLPAGKYIIQARLVDVKYSEGKYETTLFQSNDSEIVVQ